jgi:hypothetical protein
LHWRACRWLLRRAEVKSVASGTRSSGQTDLRTSRQP